jgi:hypothetical protein
MRFSLPAGALKMSKAEWLSIAKGAGIAVAGALVAFAADFVIPAMQASGSAGLLTAAVVASVLVNVARKYLAVPPND